MIDLSALTERQRQIAELIGQGLTARDVAVSLGITPQTVKNHSLAVYRALGLRDAGGRNKRVLLAAALWHRTREVPPSLAVVVETNGEHSWLIRRGTIGAPTGAGG